MTCPAGHCLAPRGRWWAAAVAGFGLISGLGPWIDAENLSSPIFAALVDWMPLRWWGVGFLAASAIAMVAVVTGRRSWLEAALAINFTVSTGWTSAIVWGRFASDLPLSMAAMGLWGFVLVTHVLLLVGLASTPPAFRPAEVDGVGG